MQLAITTKLKKDTGDRALLQIFFNGEWVTQKLIDVPKDLTYEQQAWLMDTAGDQALVSLYDSVEWGVKEALEMIELSIPDAWERCKNNKRIMEEKS